MSENLIYVLIQLVTALLMLFWMWRAHYWKKRCQMARGACRLAMNAFERNDAIDWDFVERNATPIQVVDDD